MEPMYEQRKIDELFLKKEKPCPERDVEFKSILDKIIAANPDLDPYSQHRFDRNFKR